MNSSNTRTGNSGSVSLNNYQFDFGMPSNRSSSARSSLNDQKKQPSAPPPSSYSYSSPAPPSSSSSWGAPSSKPSWTHQPATPSNPTSMVGDIFGKTWASAAPSSSNAPTLGLSQSKNPDLFGDLLGAALGQQQQPMSGGSVPLKNVGAAKTSSSFSMGNLADSLPNSANNMKSSSSVPASAPKVGSFSSSGGVPMSKLGGGGGMGGAPLRAGSSMGSSKGEDPFASLSNFGSSSASMASFQNASKPPESNPTLASYGAPPMSNFAKPSPSPLMNNYSASSAGDSFSKLNDFGVFSSPSQPALAPQPKTVDPDPLDMFASAFAGASGNHTSSAGAVDDWGSFDAGFDGADVGGSTMELEGLPPPPAGVTTAMAKDKGMDNYKQGQFADAIKWLSWAVVLLEKSGSDNTTSKEVLSCRASCYKEVGEYKKAIADCTKVLEADGTNVAVLLQRALLYESSEKYKLGAEDLRAVLKIDPSNRLARGTIHRLTKMAN